MQKNGQKMTRRYPKFLYDIYSYINLIKEQIFQWFFVHFPSAKVLLYHRVNNINVDPNKLAVSIKNFKQHINYLKKTYKIVSLDLLLNQIVNKKLQPNTIAITFDDGYLDNFQIMYPIIRKMNVPVTIFVSSSIGGAKIKTLFSKKGWISELSKCDLVIIGSHTSSHPRLSKLNCCDQEKEIKINKVLLEKVVNKSINYFAYPFGQRDDFNNTSQKILKKLKYKLAFSAYPGLVTYWTNLYRFPRYSIKNWNLSEFKKKTNL